MLTQRQRDAMLFIEAEIDRSGGAPPTIRDIVEGLRLKSTDNAHKLIAGLELRGFIRRTPHVARGIHVVRRVSRFRAYTFNLSTKKVDIMDGT